MFFLISVIIPKDLYCVLKLLNLLVLAAAQPGFRNPLILIHPLLINV